MDERRDEMIDRIVNWIHSRGLVEPALLFLQTGRPLLPIGGQVLLLMEPLLGAFKLDRDVGEYAALLEDAHSVERVLDRLDRCVAE